ncbi:putative nitrilase protein [Botrytis fragariae]|uniref:Putative nitrilase protein n=1 Tax=Botrytis fragariae TaxID=1964551 RepID=A0A8H6AI90_9HELO|nr:putative nitrilase protein [Botrytis fragariae]KAF5867703.1 putative nitrilase protein [Botrytis fragariae]
MIMFHLKSQSHFPVLAQIRFHPIRSFIVCQQYRPISISISRHTPRVSFPKNTRSFTNSSLNYSNKSFSMDQDQNTETIIGIGQLCSTADIQQNLLTCQKLAKEASEQGAKALFLPEATDYITTPGSPPTSLSLALPMKTSPFVLGLQSSAKEFSLAINVGIHVPNASGNKVLNRSIWISESGDIVGQYDKVHLFDYAAAGLKESDSVEAGKKIGGPVETCVGKVGLLICFDLRFPTASLHLRTRNTQILTYPSAFTIPTGLLHWETLLRARAIETQSYVVAAAQVGSHNVKRKSYGHSMVIDPLGRVVLDMGGEGDVEGEESTLASGKLGIARIDLGKVREAREKMPLMART